MILAARVSTDTKLLEGGGAVMAKRRQAFSFTSHH